MATLDAARAKSRKFAAMVLDGAAEREGLEYRADAAERERDDAMAAVRATWSVLMAASAFTGINKPDASGARIIQWANFQQLTNMIEPLLTRIRDGGYKGKEWVDADVKRAEWRQNRPAPGGST